MADNANFIHLRVRSTYSLLEGAMRIKPLVGLCKEMHMPAVAVTDNSNLFGSLEFAGAAADYGIQPIMGATLQLKPEGDGDSRHRAKHDELLLLAKDAEGYANLLKLVSKAYLEPADGHTPWLTLADLEGFSNGLIALTAGHYGAIGKSLFYGQHAQAEQYLEKLKTLFDGRLYIELMRHGLEEEAKIEPGLIELALKHNLPLVATNDVYFATRDMYEAHDALICVAEGTYIAEPNRRRLTPEHYFKSAAEMRLLFADIPEAVENTIAIAKRCAFMVQGKAPILPTFTSEEGASEEEALRHIARAGLEDRLQKHVYKEGMSEEQRKEVALPYRQRLEFELETIIKMKFPGYFLIVSDFITWSKEQGIPVGPGRGSGAGSVVAWALLITDLDPLRYGLLFERFLNPERVSMPDFDIDFCQDRRDEVIKYVQARYGKERVAHIITFGKLQARAVLRDVGRVLQMPYGQVDKICKLVPNNPAAPVTLEQAIDIEPLLKASIKEDETVEKLTDIGMKLEGLNRHASTHAAGVVIADRPLVDLVPLYRDPKSDMLVIQYSMKYAEAAGLVKFDFLGLKTLTVLREAVDLLRPRGIEVDLSRLPEGDPNTYKMLSLGDTTGVFQLESAGMRDTLRRLKPDTLEDIIALVSLYRPGPMDNIPTYIDRKHGREKPEYLHPLLEKVLKETFGVIIYQEQVMQIAQLLAGYSLGEADLLRRAMGKKIRSEMEAQREIFVSRAIANGVAEEQARSIFDLIAKFAEYGFNKSHAAAYAVIAYQTAFLKANYPVEFFAASMTYDMQNTDKLAIFREEAAKSSISVLPPDINKSYPLFAVEEGAIRYALGAVRNVGAQAMEVVVAERKASGPFKDIWDFAERLDNRVMNRRQMEHLIKAGAFDALHKNRRQLIESLDSILAHASASQRDRESNQVSLFGGSAGTPQQKPQLAKTEDWPPLDRLHEEFGALGFYLSSHPLQGYERALKKLNVTPSHKFADRLSVTYAPIKVAGIVTGHKIRTSAKGRFAFLQLSDASGMVEVAVFNEQLIALHRDLFENGSLVLVTAEGKMEETGPRIIAQSLAPLNDAVSHHQHGEVEITLLEADAVPQLKQLLGAPVPKGYEVTLYAGLKDHRRAEIALPGFYALSPAIIGQLSHMSGIAEVLET